MEERGTLRTFEIALDEAVLRGPEGRDITIRLNPPATLATLRSRLKEFEGEVLPVCYEPGRPHEEIFRRLITRDITVKLPSPEAEPVLPAGVTLKEKPSYAPGYAIVSAEDPFAALAALEPLRTAPQVESAEIQLASLRQKREMPNDTFIGSQWHLKYQPATGAQEGTDVNVEGAWRYGLAGGVKGDGVRIGIVDDGVDLTHEDFFGNLDITNDWDWNGNDATPSPEPGDSHGTACAGNAGARGNNGKGVAGTAPLSKIVGMRLISSAITDAQEAAAMSHMPDLIQIKSNSWGPSDTGFILEGPGQLTRAAFASAASTGRGGLGTIFTWAGGNGRHNGDNSNFDGYANDIHTIAVGAINSDGGQSYYSESGANLVVVAPSDGTASQLGITTVDRSGSDGYNLTSGEAGNYTTDFGGTSSATPTVAGVIALMLEKNPDLGWRDVKEILIRSSKKFSPLDSDWSDNSAGFHFNHRYGAGLVDATAAVELAATWTNLAPSTLISSLQNGISLPIPDNSATGVTRTFQITGDEMRVEHVLVAVSATHSYRGDLEVTLTSPSGMVSRMAEVREEDGGVDLNSWTFSSVRHWGESSNGTWTVKVADRMAQDTGTLTYTGMVLHGVIRNLRPAVTAATLSPASQAYTDASVSVTGLAGTDPENQPLTYSYEWEKSQDSVTWASAGVTTQSIPPGAVPSGNLVRCKVVASDGSASSPPLTTSAVVNLLARPPATTSLGGDFSYSSGLVLRDGSASVARDVIINEFSQGHISSAEWIELLVVNQRSLRNWRISDKDGNELVFADSQVWDDIPAGTLIVIYQWVSKDPAIPADDADPAGGTMVLSSNNVSRFGGAWPLFVDSGDRVVLSDKDGTFVAGLSYATTPPIAPHFAAIAASGTVNYRGGNEPDANLLAKWNYSTSPAVKTPALGASPANTTFVANLRSGALSSPAQFRFGSAAQVPAGLSINPETGLVTGSPTGPLGTYNIVIERFNMNPQVVSQSFSLEVTEPAGYDAWIADFPALGVTGKDDDADGDGLANLLEYYFGSQPGIPDAAAALPVIARDGGTLTLTWWRTKTATDAAALPQWSDNLATWSGSGFTITEIDETSEKEQMRATLAVGPGEEKRFLRLKVE